MGGQILMNLAGCSIGFLIRYSGDASPEDGTSAIVVDHMKMVSRKINPIALDFIQKKCPEELYRPTAYLPKLRARRPSQRATLGWQVYATLSNCQELDQMPNNLALVLAFMELSAMATYTLDDIIDAQDKREGKPATHVRFGTNDGWVAGSLQTFYSLELLEALDLPADQKLRIVQLAVQMWARMWEGEGMNEHMQEGTDLAYYLERCYKVAAIMYEAVCQMAAIIANADEDTVDLAGQLGRNFGMVAMIGNDLMCYLPATKLKQHSVAQNRVPYEDIKKGIWTIPLIEAWKNADSTQQKFFQKILNSSAATDEQCAEFVQLVTDLGGIEAALELNSHYQYEFVFEASKLPSDMKYSIVLGLLGQNLGHVRSYF